MRSTQEKGHKVLMYPSLPSFLIPVKATWSISHYNVDIYLWITVRRGGSIFSELMDQFHPDLWIFSAVIYTQTRARTGEGIIDMMYHGVGLKKLTAKSNGIKPQRPAKKRSLQGCQLGGKEACPLKRWTWGRDKMSVYWAGGFGAGLYMVFGIPLAIPCRVYAKDANAKLE